MFEHKLETTKRDIIDLIYLDLATRIDINAIDNPYTYNLEKNNIIAIMTTNNIDVESLFELAYEPQKMAWKEVDGKLVEYDEYQENVLAECVKCRDELWSSAVERLLYERKLPECFVAEYIGYLNIEKVLIHNDLPEWFIEKNLDQININNVLAHKKFSNEFLVRHKDVIDWSIASCTQSLTEDMIEEFDSSVNWDGVSLYQDLSDDFIERHQDKISQHFVNLRRANVSKVE